ncbi:hypothetical protein CXB51_005251 [Gossypium anomalum]|uniref:Aminotransferase-like plant mobile domain-containing protein n=1 Tax=Gossypium anomalum TaxID=47600 RepID=A0A8J5Z2D4_9ROSI|nr:hypothetical protein CXB51_005251 [Gossypium anomalum]
MLVVAGELIRLDCKHISVEQMKMIAWSFIIIDRKLLEGSGFLARDQYRPGMQVGPETHQRVHRELQLGLSVDESVLTRSAQSANWGAICYDLLGEILDNIYGGRIEMGLLRNTFPEPGNDLNEIERIRYARAYILEIIGGYLMPDLSRNLVHLRWLLKLFDFRAIGELSWGSVMLTTLYWEMCRATKPNKAKIEGCLSLLQSWTRFCFLFLRPRVNHPYSFPLITRWNHLTSYVGIPTALENIRLLLDQLSKVLFQWTPYEDSAMWATDRVLRQFGFRQLIPVTLEKHRQIRVERERRGPLNPRSRDNNTGPLTAPIQSPSPTPQTALPTPQPLQIMSGEYSSPYMFHFPNPMPG